MALQFNTFLRSVFWSLQFVLNAVPLITEVCCWLLQHISICSFQVLMFSIHEKKYCFVKQTSSEPGNTLLWSGSGDTCWLSSQGQVSTDYKSLFEEFVSMAPGLSEHLCFLPRCSKSTPRLQHFSIKISSFGTNVTRKTTDLAIPWISNYRPFDEWTCKL